MKNLLLMQIFPRDHGFFLNHLLKISFFSILSSLYIEPEIESILKFYIKDNVNKNCGVFLKEVTRSCRPELFYSKRTYCGAHILKVL